MKITFVTRKFRNGQRNLHCDVVHITTKWVFCLTLDCNGVFAIKAYDMIPGHWDIGKLLQGTMACEQLKLFTLPFFRIS